MADTAYSLPNNRIVTHTKHTRKLPPTVWRETPDPALAAHQAAQAAGNAAWDATPAEPVGLRSIAYHQAYQRIARASGGLLVVCGEGCALCGEKMAA